MSGPKARLLRLVQVSDCHVSGDSRAIYRGQHADRNLASLLPAMRDWQPDLILLTGDVAEDGSAAAYGRVSALLGTVGAPVLALPGNHDDAVQMRRYFPLGAWGEPLVHQARNWQLILLDSTVRNCVGGQFTADMLRHLDAVIGRSAGRNVLLALHHQPVAVGSLWIDRYALDDAEAFWEVVDRHAHVRCVTWGHVHQDFESLRGRIILLGAPSSAANSLPPRDACTLDLAGPAGRWLELDLEGGIETGLIRRA